MPAMDHGAPCVYNSADDEPAPVSVWLPELASVLGAGLAPDLPELARWLPPWPRRHAALRQPGRIDAGVPFLLVIYAVMPDVFAPYWCVEVEPASHECRWPATLFTYRLAKRRGVHSRDDCERASPGVEAQASEPSNLGKGRRWP